MPPLGLTYDTLHALNPRVVLAGSSAFGNTGPWSTRLGYGPLVRATTGATRVWTSDDAPADGARHAFYDATTIFPDHVVGRIAAILALAALIRRDRDGAGAHVHISQAEVVVNQLDTLFVTEAALAAGAEVRTDTSVHAVCPCAGDDEWCVVSIGSDDEWRCAGIHFWVLRRPIPPNWWSRWNAVDQVRRSTPPEAAQALQDRRCGRPAR